VMAKFGSCIWDTMANIQRRMIKDAITKVNPSPLPRLIRSGLNARREQQRGAHLRHPFECRCEMRASQDLPKIVAGSGLECWV